MGITLARPVRRLAKGLAAAALAACGGEAGPPEIVLDRSACARCGMLISEPRFAGAYRAGKETAVFDDIGCLLDALDEEKLETAGGGGSEPAPGDRHAEIWFLDQEQRWMTVAEARFVRSDALGTPMGGGIQAFADRATAEETATRSGGSIVDDLAELRALRRAAVVRGGS